MNVAVQGYVGHVFVDVPRAQLAEGEGTHATCTRCGANRRVMKGAAAPEYTRDIAPTAATRWQPDRFPCPDPMGAARRR